MLVGAVVFLPFHTAVVVSDGLEALAILDSARFDLILMDVQKPRLDGFAAAAEIRCRERGTRDRIPIVALTAHAYECDRERFLAAGMDAFLSKPIDPRQLESMIEALTDAGTRKAVMLSRLINSTHRLPDIGWR